MTVASENLTSFTHGWFLANCTWQIPPAKELATQSNDQLIAMINKGIIGLRPSIEKNNNAIKSFPKAADSLVSALLDNIALTFGYVPESQNAVIKNKKSQTLKDYESHQHTLSELNKNLGLRASACVHLIDDEKVKVLGKNLLAVMNILKARESSLHAGSIKCQLMKFSISMCNELKRAEYKTAITQLEKELTKICENIKTVLEKIPSGIAGDTSLTSHIQQSLDQLAPNPDPTITLIQLFDVLTDTYTTTNTAVAQKLSGLILPVEKAHTNMRIAPSHTPDPML